MTFREQIGSRSKGDKAAQMRRYRAKVKARSYPKTFCTYCWKEGASELDHVEPKASQGGRYDNLVPAHSECNAAKGTRSLLRWLIRDWIGGS